MGKRHKKTFYQRGYTGAKKHMARCPQPPGIKEMLIKTAMSYYSTARRTAKMKIK